ncbi:hypothetical protein ED208_04825 [Stagnimonas aquatica]|uniref:Uncharacterized protein n=1 Tax=Stagnimonas aquatica TaxID=2689987 RepID=A0A3N0VG12_9GAMM|nr:hypothetical protein [Stagnimonas aquatica]ROH91713.1 hypothetical protein ED208_04825 [Stagnimonas aquatica]
MRKPLLNTPPPGRVRRHRLLYWLGWLNLLAAALLIAAAAAWGPAWPHRLFELLGGSFHA